MKDSILILLFIFLFNILLPNYLFSQPLTLEEAIVIGKTNNLSLQQQENRVLQAKAELSSQKAGYFPLISLGGSYNYTSELARLDFSTNIPNVPAISRDVGANNNYNLNVSLQQPIFTGLRTTNLVKSAKEAIQVEEYQKQDLQDQILLQVFRIFYLAQLNQLQQEVLQSSLTRGLKDLLSVKNLYNAGQLSRFDTLMVSNQVLNIKTEQKKLIRDREVILTQLAWVLNQQQIREVITFSDSPIKIVLPEINNYIELAFANRSDLSRIKHLLLSQKYQKNAIRSSYFPQIYAFGSYNYGRPGVNFFEDSWMDYYSLGFNLKWELWNRNRRKNEVRKSEYYSRILTLEEEKLVITIKKEIKQVYENLQNDIEQIELLQKLVEQEAERYRVTRERYEQGLATTLDLTDAQSSLTFAELRLKQYYINWLTDQAEMARVTGKIGSSQD
jgi:outer membrane protein